MTVIADTLRAKKRLIEAGFSDEKAEGIVAIFQEADAQVATKLDLELLRKDLSGKIADLRKETKAEMTLLRSDLTTLIFKAQFAGVVGTVAILGALMGFLKLFA